MGKNYDIPDFGNGNTVYISMVEVADLPEDQQDQANGATRLYAVCHPDGERLALASSRSLAFVLARQNDYSPVTVH
jgi:hypothetical protein